VTKRDIIICRDAEELARKAAEQFVALAGAAIVRSGRFTVALSGGSTPRALYSLLGSADYRERVDWRRVQLFWVMSAVCRRITPRVITAWFRKRCCRESASQPRIFTAWRAKRSRP